MAEFSTSFGAVLSQITNTDCTVAGAVDVVIAAEAAGDLETPDLYVSTAISSGGHYWNPNFQSGDPSHPARDISSIIRANNAAAATFCSFATQEQPDQLDAHAMMLPTELGKVYFDKKNDKAWADSDYLFFYFCWLSGLGTAGTDAVIDRVSRYRAEYAPMNERDASHEYRAPSYELFTDLVVATLGRVERQRTARRSHGCSTMLRLVDADSSLGCRAELAFAEMRDMTILLPAINPKTLPSAARAEFDLLTSLISSDGTHVRIGVSHDAPCNLVFR